MSILTPDTGYGFPAVAYIQNQIGHTAIISGRDLRNGYR